MALHWGIFLRWVGTESSLPLALLTKPHTRAHSCVSPETMRLHLTQKGLWATSGLHTVMWHWITSRQCGQRRLYRGFYLYWALKDLYVSRVSLDQQQGEGCSQQMAGSVRKHCIIRKPGKCKCSGDRSQNWTWGQMGRQGHVRKWSWKDLFHLFHGWKRAK